MCINPKVNIIIDIAHFYNNKHISSSYVHVIKILIKQKHVYGLNIPIYFKLMQLPLFKNQQISFGFLVFLPFKNYGVENQ